MRRQGRANDGSRQIESVDAIILGSPIYFWDVTGEMRSFLERLLFPKVVYDANHSTLFEKRIKTGFIFTMGMKEEQMTQMGLDKRLDIYEIFMKRIFGESESLFVTDTYQFDDYAKYESTLFDAEAKANRRREEFPKDCRKAFDMGVRCAQVQG